MSPDMIETCEFQSIIYRFVDVDPEIGIDAEDLTIFLKDFNALIKEIAREASVQNRVKVRVRPFQRGSFITEFSIQWLPDLMSLLNSDPSSAFNNALGFVDALFLIFETVKYVRGKVSKYRVKENGNVEYGDESGRIEVPDEVHQLIQSEDVARCFSNVVKKPMAKFKGPIHSVEISSFKENSEEPSATVSFSLDEKDILEVYVREAEKETIEEERITEMHDLFLRPISGSYGGGTSGYIFQSGSGDEIKTYKKVRIEDEGFLASIRDGDIKLNSGDLLRVDMTLSDMVNLRTGRTRSMTCTINSVNEYRPIKKPGPQTYLPLGDNSSTAE